MYAIFLWKKRRMMPVAFGNVVIIIWARFLAWREKLTMFWLAVVAFLARLTWTNWCYQLFATSEVVIGKRTWVTIALTALLIWMKTGVGVIRWGSSSKVIGLEQMSLGWNHERRFELHTLTARLKYPSSVVVKAWNWKLLIPREIYNPPTYNQITVSFLTKKISYEFSILEAKEDLVRQKSCT